MSDEGPHLAMPPAFGSAGDERAHRRERLAGALRLLARLGYEDGVSALVTARDPERPDHCWANPFGAPLAGTAPGDLVLVDGDGRVADGGAPVNQAAFAVHAAVHRARPDVVAVAHAHTLYGRALAALGEPIEPLTQEACAFYEDHAVLDAYTGVSVDAAEARRIAVALGGRKALVLRNHGLLTVGTSVDAATWWLIQLERCSQVQLTARAAGKPVPIGHREALATRARLGGDLAAWLNYQPLWRRFGAPAPGS
ncbi:class II aldolase/adducin family protein [Streptomyces sp. NPDC047928]|uniref:class II aldolase/adducin family protein n=1 Tax=unclassified Streptomyces TaxID=2593676 RepID=UPI00371D05A0